MSCSVRTGSAAWPDTNRTIILPAIESRGAAERDRLRKSLEPILPDVKTGDTVQIDGSTKETKVDP